MDGKSDILLTTSSGTLALSTLSKVTKDSLPMASTTLHQTIEQFGQHLQDIDHNKREMFLGTALNTVVNVGLPILQGLLSRNRALTGESTLDERGFFDIVTKIGSAALPIVSQLATQFLGGGKRDLSRKTDGFVQQLVPQLASIVVGDALKVFGAKISTLPSRAVVEAEAENENNEGEEIARISKKVLPAVIAITQSIDPETRDITPQSRQRFLASLIPGLISTAISIVSNVVNSLKSRDLNEQNTVLQVAANQVATSFAPTAIKIAKQSLDEDQVEGGHARFIGAILPAIASTIVNTIFSQKRDIATESDINLKDCIDTIVPQAIPAIRDFLLNENNYKDNDEKAEKLFSLILPSILPALEVTYKLKKHTK